MCVYDREIERERDWFCLIQPVVLFCATFYNELTKTGHNPFRYEGGRMGWLLGEGGGGDDDGRGLFVRLHFYHENNSTFG